ncbi:MAG: GcrA family cell cycle regulator [Bacillota bacterium]
MGWTEERIALLKKMWLEGLSASQIAKQLGGVTRNAVIGKVHRLGLSGRATPSQPRAAAYKVKVPRAPRPVTTKPARREPAEAVHRPAARVQIYREESPGSATILTLGAHMCKWPIGDPVSDSFTFCGKRVGDGNPYCVDHGRIAYQPMQAGQKKSSGDDLVRSLRRYA